MAPTPPPDLLVAPVAAAGEHSNQRRAILPTMIENAVRAGHDPEAWLAAVLTRPPPMPNEHDVSVLPPCNWQPPAAAALSSAATA